MKYICRKILVLVLALAMIFSITACGKNIQLSMDKGGYVTWTSLSNAVRYECCIVDGSHTIIDSFFLTAPGYQLSEGFSLHLRPIFADGSAGSWSTSDYFGEPIVIDLNTFTPPSAVSVDDNGYVTWAPLSDAVRYECCVVDGSHTIIDSFSLTEPGYQLTEGFSLHLRPIFADGSEGDWLISDYYGSTAVPGENTVHGTPVSMDYTVGFDQLSTFELIGAIRWDTVHTADDGLLSFEADGPHGTMRFEATGVTAENGQLTFQPGARLWGLDAIGRICALKPLLADPGSTDNMFYFSGGYTFTDAVSVASHEELMYVWGLSFTTGDALSGYAYVDLMNWQPNFIIFGSDAVNADAFTLSGLEVFYDTSTFSTGIRYMALDSDFYGTYLTGDRYEPDREIYDLDSNLLTFYLCAVPDVQDEQFRYEPDTTTAPLSRSIIAFTPEQYEIGALRYADGTEADRTAALEVGMTLDVTVGNYTYPVRLPVNEQFRGAQNLNQLIPYGYPAASGQMNAILVPVVWQDQPEQANDENLLSLKAEVGRVMENGTVTDYSEHRSDTTRFSLSDYFDTASYGKLNISTFVTDWFVAPFDYSTYQDLSVDDVPFLEAAYSWLMSTYPDMDWTSYDLDCNGYFDAIMFVNVATSDSDSYYPWSFSGGVHYLRSYNGSLAGTPAQPAINGYINVSSNLLSHRALVHEFGHNLGLIDYYDVTYSGIDAVGCFDMQSGSIGDWNSYSKYAAGWISPTVVDLAEGETKEYTIGTFSDTGDAIVIPVHRDSYDGPFNEYILIDLFTDGGVNVHDASAYGLAGAQGVRIYHIDARMETHIETVDGVSYPLGTPARTNTYIPTGNYQVELIQAGADNTFTDLTNLRANLTQADLFQAGMSFSIDSHSEFFHNGKMNDTSDFPYTVEIISVSAEAAVIRVSAN